MSDAPLGTVFRHVRKLATGASPEVSDRDLLHQFSTRNDDTAFTALVRRHGPMVLGVCRHALHHTQDAEDAFQATFLLLARKAASIRKGEAVGSWLHGVAYRMALKVKRDAARRRAREAQAEAPAPANPSWEAAWREVQALLDEEVQRLPEKYRAPFVLCCIEGQGRAEAARHLGLKEGTVWSRLSHARKRLQERLGKRGVTLSAILAALAVSRKAVAAVPVGLLRGAASARAATLADGMAKVLFTTKLKIATAVLLAVGIVASGTGLLAHRSEAAPKPEPPARERSNRPPPVPRRARADAAPARARPDADGDKMEVAGRVLDPDGTPVGGVELAVWGYSHLGWDAWYQAGMHNLKPLLKARSGPEGKFRFTFGRSDVRHSLLTRLPNGWRASLIVASAKGYGPALIEADKVGKGELTLRLVKDDVPIKGRVRDLEGRPVAGASVEVDYLESIDAWRTLRGWSSLPAGLKTDRDGRFVLTGIGRDRTVYFHVSGPTIEHKVLTASTRPPAGAKPGAGVSVDVIVGPTKPIEGTVRARETGKPLAGAVVYGNEEVSCRASMTRGPYAVSDARGRFRLVGLPKASSYKLSIYPAAQDNYLVAVHTVADSEGLKPLTADIRLRHGIPLRFRMIDEKTGKPVAGQAWYEPTKDNPHRAEADWAPGVFPSREFMRARATHADGSFRFVAYPGPGVVFALPMRSTFLRARLDPADRARGYFPGPKGDPGNGFLEISQGYHRIDYPAGDKVQTFDIILRRGRELKGSLLDPEGKPVSGATTFGLTFDASAPRPAMSPAEEVLKTNIFLARGLYPGEPRSLSFVHKDRKLIAHVIVNGTEDKALTVRMRPWGAVRGRLVDAAGKPRAGVAVHLHYSGVPRPGIRGVGTEVKTDDQGRFRLEGLVSGLKHQLTFWSGGKDVRVSSRTPLNGLSPAAGEVKDVGDVRVDMVPAKKK